MAAETTLSGESDCVSLSDFVCFCFMQPVDQILKHIARGQKMCTCVIWKKHTLCFISGFHLVWTLMVLSDSYLVYIYIYMHKYALRSTSLLPCYLCNDLPALGNLTFKSKLSQYTYRAITASLLISLVVTALDELKVSSCCSGRASTVQVRPIKSLDPLNWILLTYLNYKLHLFMQFGKT